MEQSGFSDQTKGDRSARFLVDFRAVNAKSEPLYCSLSSTEEVFDQIGDEKPKIYTVMEPPPVTDSFTEAKRFY